MNEEPFKLTQKSKSVHNMNIVLYILYIYNSSYKSTFYF